MRSRADWCADDKAVAGIAGHYLAVDNQVQADHVERRPRLQSNFIEAQDDLPSARPLDQALEHEMLGDAIVALDDAGKDVAQFFRAEVGQKTEPTEIDAEHGRLMVAHLAGR